MAKVKLSSEEMLSLYHFHMDIAEDTKFACKSDHNEKIAEDRRKRAGKFKRLLKKEFGYQIKVPAEE